MKIKNFLFLSFRKIVIFSIKKSLKFNILDRIKHALIHIFYSNYHPLDIFNKQEKSKRNVINRLNVITKNLSGDNCLDIGCQSGYFSLNIANNGYWVTGLDRDDLILEKARLLQKKFQIKNVSFVNFNISESSISRLQNFDNVIYLSIHHHMIKVYGFETATKILKCIANKTNKNLFFDFPYPDAYKDNPSFAQIPEMGEDPDKWIKNYLLSVGFAKVESIGKFSHNQKKHEVRNLFKASK